MKNPYKSMSDVSPQKERGTRRIASDVFYALNMAKLSGAEYQVVNTVINLTWGFNKTDAQISYNWLAGLTNLSRRTVIKTVAKLVYKRTLLVDKKVVNKGLPVNTFQFNKYYDTWIGESGEQLLTTSQLKLVKKMTKTGEFSGTKVVSKHSPIIESNRNNKGTKISSLPKTHETELTTPGQKLLQEIGINPPNKISPKTNDLEPPENTEIHTAEFEEVIIDKRKEKLEKQARELKDKEPPSESTDLEPF